MIYLSVVNWNLCMDFWILWLTYELAFSGCRRNAFLTCSERHPQTDSWGNKGENAGKIQSFIIIQGYFKLQPLSREHWSPLNLNDEISQSFQFWLVQFHNVLMWERTRANVAHLISSNTNILGCQHIEVKVVTCSDPDFLN